MRQPVDDYNSTIVRLVAEQVHCGALRFEVGFSLLRPRRLMGGVVSERHLLPLNLRVSLYWFSALGADASDVAREVVAALNAQAPSSATIATIGAAIERQSWIEDEKHKYYKENPTRYP